MTGPESDGIEVDLGAGAVSVLRELRGLDFTSGHAIPIPAEGPINWAQLSKLNGVITLSWKGPGRGVVEAVRANRILTFCWYDADGDVDLTGTHVTDVRLSGAGLHTISLPRSTTMLMLDDPPPGLRLEAPGLVELRVFTTHEKITVPQFPRVRRLWLRAPRKISVSALDGFTEIEWLRLDFTRPPGTLTGVPLLARLDRLRRLEILGGYDWDPNELPELPNLAELTLFGTRRATVAALKARFEDTRVRVEANAVKTDQWLSRHLNNPFRDWVDESHRVGTAACKAYVRAAETIRSGDVQAGLLGLVADLNTIHSWHTLDTYLRESAWAGFRELAASAGVGEAQASQWFDGGRVF